MKSTGNVAPKLLEPEYSITLGEENGFNHNSFFVISQ
jgi:hypothetical protein